MPDEFAADASTAVEAPALSEADQAELGSAGLFDAADEGTSAKETQQKESSERRRKAPAKEEPVERLPETQAGDTQSVVPDYIEIDGQRHKIDDIVKSRKEADRRIRELTEETGNLRQADQILRQLWGTPAGQKALTSLARGDPLEPDAPKETFRIPTDPDGFDKWLAEHPYENLGKYMDQRNGPRFEQYDKRVSQLEGTLQAVLGFLESQLVEKKYGPTLNEVRPYIEQVQRQLGPNAQYYPTEHKLLMALGIKAREQAAQASQTEQAETKLKEQKEKHREKALAATVESARGASEAGGRVIDVDKMSVDELEKYILKIQAATGNVGG